MKCEDSRFAFVRRAPYCDIKEAFVRNEKSVVGYDMIPYNKCENRLNLIMWLYWDSGIPGIPLKYIQILPGEVFECKTTENQKIAVNLITKKYCNGDDIVFNEVSFAK